MISVLDRLGAREQTAVDRVHNRSSSNHPAVKVAAVQTLDGVLSTLHLVELEVDVAGRVGVERDVDHVAVLLFGLLANLLFELLGPILTLLPTRRSVTMQPKTGRGRVHILGRVKHVAENHTATRHVDIDRQWLCLSLGLENLSLGRAAAWLVSSSELPHEGVSAVIVKVDAGNVSVIQRTGTGALVVISAAGAIKVGRRGSSAPGPGKGRSLELLLLLIALEPP